MPRTLCSSWKLFCTNRYPQLALAAELGRTQLAVKPEGQHLTGSATQ